MYAHGTNVSNQHIEGPLCNRHCTGSGKRETAEQDPETEGYWQSQKRATNCPGGGEKISLVQVGQILQN